MLADSRADSFDVACGGFAQQVLELGEDLLDWIQVGRVFRQEEQLRADGADQPAHAGALMTAEIVHDDDVAGMQSGAKDLLDIGGEGLAVDRAIEKPRRLDPIVPQCGEEGRGLPVSVRDLGYEPGATQAPSAQRRHIGLGPGFVDKRQTPGVNQVLMLCPLRPPARDVRTTALASHHGFF